jgi:hypothetical protein
MRLGGKTERNKMTTGDTNEAATSETGNAQPSRASANGSAAPCQQCELNKSRNVSDSLAAALMGEYSRSEALAEWAADLKLPDNSDIVDRLKSEGVPVDRWVRRLNESYEQCPHQPNAALCDPAHGDAGKPKTL